MIPGAFLFHVKQIPFLDDAPNKIRTHHAQADGNQDAGRGELLISFRQFQCSAGEFYCHQRFFVTSGMPCQ